MNYHTRIRYIDRFDDLREDATLPDGEIHVRFARLSQLAEIPENSSQVLSADERARARRFHFERDRRAFVMRRILLRRILASYLGVCPQEIVLAFEYWGRPVLKGDWGNNIVRFSASGSRDWIMLAFARAVEIGVDIEQIRDFSGMEIISKQFFTQREAHSLRALPLSDQTSAFFHCWTCKEAVLKAIGYGLSFGLESIEVTVDPHAPARLLSIQGDTARASHWSLQTVPAAPEAAATLAVNHAARVRDSDCELETLHKRMTSIDEQRKASTYSGTGGSPILEKYGHCLWRS